METAVYAEEVKYILLNCWFSGDKFWHPSEPNDSSTGHSLRKLVRLDGKLISSLIYSWQLVKKPKYVLVSFSKISIIF